SGQRRRGTRIRKYPQPGARFAAAIHVSRFRRRARRPQGTLPPLNADFRPGRGLAGIDLASCSPDFWQSFRGDSMKSAAAAAWVLAVTLAVSGCTSDGSASGKRGMTNMEAGAAIGAAGGAAVGALVTKKRLKGALIGAVGGGLAGGAVGAYMDSQKK